MPHCRPPRCVVLLLVLGTVASVMPPAPGNAPGSAPGNAALGSESSSAPAGGATSGASFAALAQRLASGQPTTIAFLGGSLTFGANASAPNRTSWRARMEQYLRTKYPHTPLRFVDAAIGGTGSSLGLFRLQRDVLAYHPDLVFLEFTVNDNIRVVHKPWLIDYETIMRRLIGRGIPVMQVVLAVKEDYGKAYNLERVPLRAAHLQLSQAYHTPVADVLPLLHQAVVDKQVDLDKLWPFDGTHPGDLGYEEYFELIHPVLDRALAAGTVCQVPAKPVFGEITHVKRIDAASLKLPAGWALAKTYRTSLWFDGLSSRWMDQVAVYTASGTESPPVPQVGSALVVHFRGTMVGLFGEMDGKGLPYLVKIDGKTIAPKPAAREKIGDLTAFKADTQRFGGHGRLFFWQIISEGLPPGAHTLEILPVVVHAKKGAQLRIGAVCTAG